MVPYKLTILTTSKLQVHDYSKHSTNKPIKKHKLVIKLHLMDVVSAGPHQDFSLAYFVSCLNKLCMYVIHTTCEN